jgi:protein ImuB
MSSPIWIALFFPNLSLEVFTRALDPSDHAPLRSPSGHRIADHPAIALCDHLRVLQSNPVAQSKGVRTGMKRATALSLIPDLLIASANPRNDQDMLEQTGTWALQFTPSVSLQSALAPQGLLLEVSASLNLFKGLEPLLSHLHLGMREFGLNASISSAPTATGAWLLALAGRAQHGAHANSLANLHSKMADLDLHWFAHAKPHIATLNSMGVRSVRDFLRLPRAGLARRFGQELLDELDRALGKKPELRLWFNAPAEFHIKLELLAQVEHAQALMFAGKRMFIQLAAWLVVQHCAVRAYRLQAFHDCATPTTIDVELADPCIEAERMTNLLRERLDRITLPEAAHTLTLEARDIIKLDDAQRSVTADLFPATATGNDADWSVSDLRGALARLVERLQNRLGRDQVLRIGLAQDHRPEAAYHTSTLKQSDLDRLSKPSTSSVQYTQDSLPRPLWLLQEPIPMSERNNRPWYRGQLNLLAGPERIESGWWDQSLVQRDYFIAEDEHANLFWIFRTRASQASNQWYVQGRFA